MRQQVSVLALVAASAIAGPGRAADDFSFVPDDLRVGYPTDWEPEDTTLTSEIGVRYWYSLGSQSIVAFGDSYTSNDTSHIIEGHARVEDGMTSSYAKGYAGFAGRIDGDFVTPAESAPLYGGTIGYAGADFGWMPLGNEAFQFGGLVGYQYWTDSPDMGRASFVTAAGGDSEVNALSVHSLRLGLSGKAEISEMFDITAELAAVPYGNVSGTFGAHDIAPTVFNGVLYQKSSATTVSGHLWGAEAELMLGIHPTENLAFRIGGRAWYLTGPVEATFSMSEVGNPGNSVNLIGELEDFTMFRYGAIAEVSYKF